MTSTYKDQAYNIPELKGTIEIKFAEETYSVPDYHDKVMKKIEFVNDKMKEERF